MIPVSERNHSGPQAVAEGKRFVFVLPLPPKELSPNARVHWAAKAKATKRYRIMSWAEAAEQDGGIARWKHATAQATFFFKVNRRRDRDNLLASLKPAFDGFVDAGVLADDAGLIHLPVEIDVDRENPRVEIAVAAVEVAKSEDAKVVAIDFDGVIVKEAWPSIGKLLPGAVQAMRRINARGFWIIVHSCRAGKHQDEAIAFLRDKGVPFDAFNANLEHRTSKYGSDCRKMSADVYVDDRNLGGFPGWPAVLRALGL